ncbi:MAG: PepSY domain-containing protein [Rhodocyclaceae bacterium]
MNKLLCALAACLMAAPATAGDRFEQDRARAAVQSGQAMSFARVQERMTAECGCQVLEAKLHDEKDHGVRYLVYEIKALASNGQIVKVEMNAQTGEVLRMKRKGGH